MPTPANALFWGSLLVSQPTLIESSAWMIPAILLLVVLTSLLLVSELPMFALKFKQWGWRGNELRYSFIALSGVVIALFGVIGGMWIVITLYFLTSVVADIVSRTHTTVDIEK